MSGTAPEAITILGNCQGGQLAQCLRRMLPGTAIEFVRYFSDADMSVHAEQHQNRLILVQNPVMSFGSELDLLRDRQRVIDFPAIVHAGFHPDLIRPKVAKALVQGPLGSNHSALILHAYLTGLNEQETRSLFCDEVFAAAGYFETRAESDQHLRAQFMRYGLADDDEVERLLAGGCFMHNTIHPKLSAIAALARMLLRKVGIAPVLHYPENLMADELANNVIWPVYPEIARRHGVQGGEYAFQFKPTAKATFDLDRFIAASFESYADAGLTVDCHPRLSSPEFAGLELVRSRAIAGRARARNPYRDLPDHHFWRRAVAAVGHGQVDPVTNPAFRLDASTRIGTAGSCFAQHIARRLAASGHHYLVTESGDDLAPAERLRRNYGVYSARYGNLYTTRQLRQLFQRAHGLIVPSDVAWQREDGRFVDPFRPEIEPDGHASAEDVAASRDEHLGAVRQMFRDIDVLVFTLGLTEAWRSVTDGSVFPLCPMVVSPGVDAPGYEPVNFTHAEMLDDLMQFIALLREVNPTVKLLLTVSPVPLIATFEDRHVMVSTAASKAILRSVADEACRIGAGVSYFPSFEIVANPYFAESYFDPVDCRSVRPDGVDHVMRVFLKHYSLLAPAGSRSERYSELDEEQKVVCEEERLNV